jgi:hypothetical protein
MSHEPQGYDLTNIDDYCMPLRPPPLGSDPDDNYEHSS